MKLRIFALYFLFTPAALPLNNSYIGKGWNVVLNDSCGQPSHSKDHPSIMWNDEVEKQELVFTLNPGEIGKCPTDSNHRHGAPYWERAEVRQYGNLTGNQNYRIKFDVKFIQGFSSERETFFQIHTSNKKCFSAPILMMKFNYGLLTIDLLSGISATSKNGNHKNKYLGNIYVRDLKKYNSFEVVFNQKRKIITIYKDGITLIKNQNYEKKECGTPYLKLGIYRPGNEQAETSKSSYKNITVEKIY